MTNTSKKSFRSHSRQKGQEKPDLRRWGRIKKVAPEKSHFFDRLVEEVAEKEAHVGVGVGVRSENVGRSKDSAKEFENAGQKFKDPDENSAERGKDAQEEVRHHGQNAQEGRKDAQETRFR